MTRKKSRSIDDRAAWIQAAACETKALLAAMAGRMISRMLEGEMDHHLGYRRREGTAVGNERNGHSAKTLRSEKYGRIVLRIPRDRRAGFDPKAIPKHQRRDDALAGNALALHACGLSARKIRSILRAVYGGHPCPALLAAVESQVQIEIKQWQARPIKPSYEKILLDGFQTGIPADHGPKSLKRMILVLGISADGSMDILEMLACRAESAELWRLLLDRLRLRGVTDIRTILMPEKELGRLSESARECFPEAALQKLPAPLIRD